MCRGMIFGYFLVTAELARFLSLAPNLLAGNSGSGQGGSINIRNHIQSN